MIDLYIVDTILEETLNMVIYFYKRSIFFYHFLQNFLQAWDSVCQDSSSSPTLLVPQGYTFLLQSIQFNGPCQSEIHIQVIVILNCHWLNGQHYKKTDFQRQILFCMSADFRRSGCSRQYMGNFRSSKLDLISQGSRSNHRRKWPSWWSWIDMVGLL